MTLDDLPEELLSKIFEEIYPPWYLQAIDDPNKGVPVLIGVPAMPSSAPLLTCKKTYRIGKGMPSDSFNGLLDIWTKRFNYDLFAERKGLLPFIYQVWIANMSYWYSTLCWFPSLRSIEWFESVRWTGKEMPEVSLGRKFPPNRQSEPLKSYWVSTRQFFRYYEGQFKRKPRIYHHFAYRLKPRNANECPESKGAMFDLVYLIDSNHDDEYDLVGYRRRPSNPQRSEICWDDVPKGMPHERRSDAVPL